VVFDPAGTTRVSAATHHSRVDYNLYEGRALAGAIDLVMARGEIIVEQGTCVGRPGRGRFLARAPFTW
jgi:dihydropyrimidinase